jgi:starch-binding outer membrane protein, SusD/RagB family
MNIYIKSISNLSLVLVIIITLPFFLIGCDDFLTTSPENSISDIDFFQNDTQFEQAVIGAYSKLQNMYEFQWRLTELRSDNTTVMFNDANRGPHPMWFLDEFTDDATNQNLAPYWQHVYEGIQRTNTVLVQIEDFEFNNEGLKNQLIGEAKFLRGFYYFNLVRLFGGVPLVLDQVRSPDDAFTTLESRASKEDVFNQILRDVNDAAELLPANYTGSDIGRATEGAARTLLADIHMTLNNYSEAIVELESVMAMGYSLLPEFSDIFDPSNKNHDETIFDVNYAELDHNRSLGSNFIYFFAPFTSGSQITGFSGTPTGVNIPTRGILNAFEEGDLRKESSIGYFIDPVNSQHGIAIGDTIPYIKKYDWPHQIQGVTNSNWPVYRYAHVLLMMAESVNEIDGPDEAYTYINEVRQRADLDDLPQGLNQSQFREAIIHEQRVELAFENHRWFQLLRTDRAMEAMQAHGDVHRNIQPHLTEPAYIIEEYKFTYPIPQRELTLNPNLEQNPGW